MASGIGFKTLLMGWLLSHSLLSSAEIITYASNGRPYCNSAKSDPDGDGFGWENKQTCLVRGGSVDPAKTAAVCPDSATVGGNTIMGCPAPVAAQVAQMAVVMPTADKSALPVPIKDTLKATPGGTPYCTPLAVDPDEDGFGWENSRSCVVRFTVKDPARGAVRGCTIQTTTHPYCSIDRAGWGFEKGRACVGYSYCPANRNDAALAGSTFGNMNLQAKAQPNTRAVYDFLRSIHGHYILSGQMDKVEIDSYDMARRVYDETGKWPALMGYDFMNYTRPNKRSSVPGGRKQVTEATAHWRNGGLVSFLWHWRDPLGRNDHFYSHSTQATIPIDRYGRLDRKDPMMAAIDADIAVIAKALGALQDAGVPVLWRPLHEAAGGWFWWGRSRTDGIPAAYAQVILWRYLHAELTQRYRLHNLIWVWNGQHAGWYPGDDYVDILGYDSYPGRPDNGAQLPSYNATARMSLAPKMVAMTENGNLPDPDWLDAEQANWIWFMSWNDFHPVGLTTKTNFWSGEFHNTSEHKRHVYNHSRVLTLEDLQSIDLTSSAEN